jgi:hypothetical protein
VALFAIAASGLAAFLAMLVPSGKIRAISAPAFSALALLAVCLTQLLPNVKNGSLLVTLLVLWVLIAHGLALVVLYRAVRGAVWQYPGTGRREVVLLIPFGLLLSGSMSSGGYPYGLYLPIAFLILLLPAVLPAVFENRALATFLVCLAGLMAMSAAYSRAANPVSWHSFHSSPMFTRRLIVHHPAYGPMLIEKKTLRFIEPICSTIQSEGPGDLLSLPLPYANYYCNIPPWQGFVQSFFDTAGKDVIDDMMSKLETCPPKWILYQRQLDNLALHERAFNGGRKLPQRDLDVFLMDGIEKGKWQVVQSKEYGEGNLWLLLRTN